MNDPVMGGQSVGTFSAVDDLGIFDGQVVDVPFLAALGFIKVDVVDNASGGIFPDISSCSAITLDVNASDFAGYRFSSSAALLAASRLSCGQILGAVRIGSRSSLPRLKTQVSSEV